MYYENEKDNTGFGNIQQSGYSEVDRYKSISFNIPRVLAQGQAHTFEL